MNKGFTLIELLVVVLIIGILTAIALPQYETAVEKSRASEAFVNGAAILESMDRAISERPNENPSHKDDLDVKLSGGSWNASGNVYTTKDFRYDISNGTFLLIRRDLGNGDYYDLTLYNHNHDREGVRTCAGGGEKGRSLCQSFASAGYEEAD